MERHNRQRLAAGVLLLVIQFQFIAVDATAEICDLPNLRELSKSQVLGGWRFDNSTASRRVAENAIANLKSSGGNPEKLVKQHHVIEAFSQVVQGKNYCVYFSASGKCDDYHCKSYECTARGHLPLTSRDDNIEINGVQCDEQNVCDFERVAKMAQTPMPGGWHNAAAGNENVHKLHQTASAIATVEPGEVIEAYSQVVAGFNFCIRFRSNGAANCARNCKPVTCTASGFAPLAHQTTNTDSLTRIGVDCQPADHAALRLGTNSSSAGRLMANAIATVLFIVLAHLF